MRRFDKFTVWHLYINQHFSRIGTPRPKKRIDFTMKDAKSTKFKNNNFRILRTTILHNLRETRKFFASRNSRIRLFLAPRRQVQKSFLLCAFASLREMFRFFWLRLRCARVFVSFVVKCLLPFTA